MADALIYTTSVVEDARLVTGDVHFANPRNVTIL